MFDKPTLALLIAYAAFPNLAAFALVSYISVIQGRVIDALGWTVVLFIGFESLYAIVMQLQGELENYKHMRRLDTPKKTGYRNQPSEIPVRQYLNMNENIVQTVSIDAMGRKIKQCCRTLIDQHEHGFKVDLREETWKAHFGGRDNFVQFRDVIMARAFAKESTRTNSPFVIVDLEEVRRGAEGRLPH